MFLSFQTDMSGQTVQTQIRLLSGSSLIRVYTVCHSVCIVWTHYSMVEPHSYAPTSKKLTGHIGFGLCVRPSVHPSVQEPCMLGFCIFIYGLHMENIWHIFFLSKLSPFLPFWSYAPLKKSQRNLMHAISYEPCMLGFWNFIYGFLMEK